MTDWRNTPDRECIRRYYEEQNEDAFNAFFERNGPKILAALRRYAWSRHGSGGSGTSSIEPEDAMQHAFAQLLMRRYPVDSPMSVQSWLFVVGRNYMIDPWRPRALNLRIFRLWPGSRPDHAGDSETDWLGEHLSDEAVSTMGQQPPAPGENVLRADAEHAARLRAFRHERDRWLASNWGYAPVIELISAGVERGDIGEHLGTSAADILLEIVRAEQLVPEQPPPDRARKISAQMTPERAGALLHDMALARLAQRLKLNDELGMADIAGDTAHPSVPSLARAEAARDSCLATMDVARQRAIRLSDDGFTGAEIGILEGRTERAGQLLVNRARKQLLDLLNTAMKTIPDVGPEEERASR